WSFPWSGRGVDAELLPADHAALDPRRDLPDPPCQRRDRHRAERRTRDRSSHPRFDPHRQLGGDALSLGSSGPSRIHPRHRGGGAVHTRAPFQSAGGEAPGFHRRLEGTWPQGAHRRAPHAAKRFTHHRRRLGDATRCPSRRHAGHRNRLQLSRDGVPLDQRDQPARLPRRAGSGAGHDPHGHHRQPARRHRPRLPRPPGQVGWRKGMKVETKRRKPRPSWIIGGAWLVLIGFVIAALLAPLLAPYEPTAQILTDRLLPPLSEGHLLGTDALGRDVLTRLLYGARISIAIGIATVVLTALIGVAIGLISGYVGGWLDTVIMRIVDIWLAFPF